MQMTRRNDIGKHLDLIFRTTVLGQKVSAQENRYLFLNTLFAL